MQLALDITDVEAMTLAARQIPFPGGILQQWLPNATRLDHRYRFLKQNRALRSAAPFRAWDTPAVPIKRGDRTEVTGRMLPISIILPLLEEESQLLDVARLADNAEAVEELFDSDTLEVTRRVLQRVMLAQGEAVSTLKVTIGTEDAQENGLELGAVDFGQSSANFFDADEDFSDPDADVIGMFVEFVQQFVIGTGNEVRPGVFVAPTRVLNALALNTGFRTLLGSILGTPQSVGLDQINQVLASRQLPRMIVDDTAVPDVGGAMTRQVADNRILFLPEPGTPIGQTQWGTTEESKKLARAQALDPANQPGLVVVPMESENPVQTATLGTAIVMPVITEPDLVMSVKVLDIDES